jgi:hypothetical protein
MTPLRWILLLALAATSGCTATPPPSLGNDEAWRSVMRSGFQKSRGTVFVPEPSLSPRPDLTVVDGLRIRTDSHSLNWYWPLELTVGFGVEMEEVLHQNTGYEVTLWTQSLEAPEGCDYELRLRVTDYRLVLLEVGLGSSMATFWLTGMVHLATFYNAPDELYLCEYEVQADLFDLETQTVTASRVLRGSKELALTDFQRGWTLYSYWPNQRLNWLPDHDAATAWRTYAESVIESVEPHARRTVLVELLRFLREQPLAAEPPTPKRDQD